MTSWRPANTITVKALALIWRDDALLLSEIHDDAGRVKGMRPLGGTVEFGEPWRDTLQREFLEELGTRIGLLDRYIVMENLFEHHGTPGHEIVFLCDAYFEDSNFYQRDIITVQTSEEIAGIARWASLDELAARRLDLYPTGLRDRLVNPGFLRRSSHTVS
ncbi:NUDIX hydrolase [Roseibium salinum]|uniref:NUDIX domain-containing protein n=1 Tax=Roseibium salinum TaxID=1604349 RepID=A0ABT3QYW3_9HYPH|nr:NUDIX domain-containing protein [Roseibium sp. DSM 29163]MCX2722145.1 NUDIX domain-containing protein [Roseibium sp. DSM 29163]